ncbi:MAG: response regulator [Planctomycetota bacterium]|nr:response regulator [Planctomycetota bacterium]
MMLLDTRTAILAMRILVVDDDPAVARLIVSRLSQDGYRKVLAAPDAAAAYDMVSEAEGRRAPFDLVIMEFGLRSQDGGQLTRDIRSISKASILLLASQVERPMAMEALASGADDCLITPFDPDLLLVKVERLLTRRHLEGELRRSTARNEGLFLNILTTMAKVIEAKDPYTRYHSEKVSDLSRKIAMEMGFVEEEVRRIGIAGVLHDLGKLGIRDAILRKPAALNEEERRIIQKHPLIASTILEPIEQLSGSIGYIKFHHEHFDGSGYPEGLAGEDIPLGARILHAAEAFDAMTSKRAYHDPMPRETALMEMRRLAGAQFDPQVVEALTQVLKRSGLLLLSPREARGRTIAQILSDITNE